VHCMKSRSLAPVFPALLLAVLACSNDTNNAASYGEKITLEDTTKISQILASPEAYVGERVLVAGTVVEVCEMRGCWVELGGDREFETIRVKVEDGVIVFPMSARGKQAVVEGVVEELVLTEEQVLEQARHHAEETGTEFDPSTVTGPSTTYQIRGLGALIGG